MHQAKDLTWKQERFVSEYLLSGNAAEAVRRAGYQTRYPSEIGYGLKRYPKVRAALIEAQEARARRLEIQADLVASKYVELMERALDAKDFETALQTLNQLCQRLRIFERLKRCRYVSSPLKESVRNYWRDITFRITKS